MTITPYLTFDGHCKAAFEYYAQHLGGKIETMTTFGGSPGCEQMPAEFHHRIMHAHIVIGSHALMASDAMPMHPYEAIKGISVALGVDTIGEAERIFAALAQGGTIIMPLQQTFWALRFGMVTDAFGVPWMINCEQVP